MPRLNTVAPDQAQGAVQETYENLTKKMGKVLNIFQGMGNSSAALNGYIGLSQTLAGGELSEHDREVIYLGVSQANQCNYCIAAHTVVAKGKGMAEEETVAIRKGQPTEAKHQALLAFVNKVMETRGFVADADIQAVRDAGYTDGQIAETIGYIGLATFSNFFNHVYDTPLDFPEPPAI